MAGEGGAGVHDDALQLVLVILRRLPPQRLRRRCLLRHHWNAGDDSRRRANQTQTTACLALDEPDHGILCKAARKGGSNIAIVP